MISAIGQSCQLSIQVSLSLEAPMLVLVESIMVANSSVIDSLVLYAGTPDTPVRHVIEEKRYAVSFPEIVS